jgi:hypothetical protein
VNEKPRSTGCRSDERLDPLLAERHTPVECFDSLGIRVVGQDAFEVFAARLS